jgi:hypothetical protein
MGMPVWRIFRHSHVGMIRIYPLVIWPRKADDSPWVISMTIFYYFMTILDCRRSHHKTGSHFWFEPARSWQISKVFAWSRKCCKASGEWRRPQLNQVVFHICSSHRERERGGTSLKTGLKYWKHIARVELCKHLILSSPLNAIDFLKNYRVHRVHQPS